MELANTGEIASLGSERHAATEPYTQAKIVERWGELDNMGFMIQIGAIPPPGEGGK